jgi:hypothetical protein
MCCYLVPPICFCSSLLFFFPSHFCFLPLPQSALGLTRMCNIQATRLQFFGTTESVRRRFCNKFREIYPSYRHHSWNKLLKLIWEWNAFLLYLCYASEMSWAKVRKLMIHVLAYRCVGNSMVNSYSCKYFAFESKKKFLRVALM